MKVGIAGAFLLIAAFLAPMIGGQINTESQTLAPGLLSMLESIFVGTGTPTLQHTLIAGIAAASLAASLIARRVAALPKAHLLIPVFGFFGLLAFSLFLTSYLAVSIVALLEWLAYGTAFFACALVLGRKSGPVLFISTMAAGTTFVALQGVGEYLSMAEIDPSWRIFAGWTPNSLAGVLGIGLMLAIGLMLHTKGILSAVWGVSGVLMATGIVLTQSKGGYVAVAAALPIFGASAWFWIPRNSNRQVIRVALALIAIPCLAFGLATSLKALAQATYEAQNATPAIAARSASPMPAKNVAAPTVLGRVADPSQSAEQSAGFRKLLWKGSWELAQQMPLGYGVGTYRFESTRPGLTTQTHLAHNSYLQILVEGGVLSLLAYMAIAVAWISEALRGRRGAPPGLVFVRAGVFAAVSFSAVHSLIDSDLYSFGIGWSFFALLAVSLLLNSDSLAPEFSPKTSRWSFAAAVILIPLGLLYFGAVEAIRSRARYERDELRTFVAAKELAEASTKLAPFDGENWRLLASLAPTPFERGMALDNAARHQPNARNLRAYAQHLAEQGDVIGAESFFERALEVDPHNLATLTQLWQAKHAAGDLEGAISTAKRLVNVEQTQYFQVRSLPEMVPTETFDAAAFVAQNTENPSERIRLFEVAIQGYAQFMRLTVPRVRQMAVAYRGNEDAQLAGVSMAVARQKLTTAIYVAGMLASDYRRVGSESDAARIELLSREFRDAAMSELPK